MKRFWPTVFSLVLIAVFVISLVPQARPAYASASGVVISQVYGGGGNSGATYKNDFIELYNAGPTAVSLNGWSVQYGSASGTTWGNRTNLSGTILPGHYFLIKEAAGSGGTVDLPTPDAIGTIAMAAGSGKVALVSSTTALSGTGCPFAASVVDFVGYGTPNCSETSPAPVLDNSTADLRKADGVQDTDNNAADFVAGTPNPRNSDYPGPSGQGSATPNVLLHVGDSVVLTVTVTPGAAPSDGFSVTCDLTGIGASATQQFFDDGTNGDAVANDNTFTFSTAITAAKDNRILCTVSDSQGKHGRAVINLNLLLTIGVVNGPVGDTDNGTQHTSPFVGRTVIVQGVIYEKTLQATSGSSTYKGFYMQSTALTTDNDLTTSDGLFVYNGTFTTLIDGYRPTVGDDVIVSGTVTEYFNMTELTSVSLVGKVPVRSGVVIDNEVAPIVANPPANLADANRYWERMQGMRVQVPQNSIVLGGRNVFSPADAEVWVAAPASSIAQRADPYTRRAFRDAHPLDDNYDPLNWDGNGYRILMGSLGIKATVNDPQALIAPLHTFQTVTNAPAGGLNYTFSKYRIEISDLPQTQDGVDPAANDAPTARALDNEFTIVDYNLENLYDLRDNPFSACDYNGPGNAGCLAAGTPFIGDVNPSYNYVPASEEDYQKRLSDIASQIVNDLHSPDILMVQEVENQDVCSVVAGAVDCGTNLNNPDGRPDVLQDLAVKIASLGGPTYDSAFDRDSSDLRGILPAFLFRTDRVELRPAAGDPVLGTDPMVDYAGDTVPANADISNPKTFNAVLPTTFTAQKCETNWVFPRAPDVGLFRIHAATAGANGYRDVYVIDNHFKSGPDTCVAHRTEQAKYNAALVNFIEAANPNAGIVMGGDLNVYPRPDDPFAPIGQAGSTDQLGSLYTSTNLSNLLDGLMLQAPQSAYSYVYLGMAQTLDQMFLSPSMMASLEEFRIAHINSDFPADYTGDVARGTSDHDPSVAKFKIFDWTGFVQPVDNLPKLNVVKAGVAVPVKFSLDGDQGLSIFALGYPISTKIACDTAAGEDSIEQSVTAGSSSLQYDPLTTTYTYVWKTEKSWAGTCRQLSVTLVDGSNYQANFDFTK